MTTYRVLVNGEERLRFSADFASPESPLIITAPFQVADVRHCPIEAARLLNDWLRSGEMWGHKEQIVVAPEESR